VIKMYRVTIEFNGPEDPRVYIVGEKARVFLLKALSQKYKITVEEFFVHY
jgi:hypothetical protein